MSNEPEPKKPKVKLTPSRSWLRATSGAESGKETVQWLDKVTERMAFPGEHEEAFFTRRRDLKLGVGLDESGNLVQAVETPKK
ncbi:hypothetical protein DYI23_03845 [Roseibium polysiphoniae]|uniref:Uncharacterized protein n=1 Tax=Roseibium polysiphoniae TaxID=2571221 RepID=A0A944C8Z0_9HYPH|nr:hypothetical protein [Roseibium polysiphoniae]MBS8259346.1 hypothetical protein [Roseibium polysiphoniae]